MKRKLYLTAMLLMLAILGMSAQSYKSHDRHSVFNIYKKNKAYTISNYCQKEKEESHLTLAQYNKPPTETTNNHSDEEAELIIIFSYDTLKYDISSLMVYNNNFSVLSHPHDYVSFDQAIKSARIRLPKGEYDIYTCSYLRDGTSDIPIYHIIENVNVSQNTEITADITDSDNLFSFELFTLNGDAVTFDKIKWIDEEPWEIIESYGNVAIATWLSGLVLDGYGMVTCDVFGGSFLEGDHYPGFFYINDLSSRYYLSYRGLMLDKQGNWYADNLSVNNTEECPLHNNPQDYIPYTEGIKPSTSFANNYNNHSVYLPCYDNGVAYWVLQIDNYQPDNGIVFLNISERKNHDYNLNATAKVAIQDSVVETFREWWYNDENGEIVTGVDTIRTVYNLVGPEVMVNNDGNLNYSINSPYYSRISYDEYASRYPEASVFSLDIEKKNSIIGNNCPVNVVAKALSQYNHSYIGYFGETRNADLIDEKLHVSYNDSLIYDGLNRLDSLRYACLNHLPAGQLYITLYNDNVRVDNINGFNKTEMFFDQTLGDVDPPSLQMLQFRDTDGFVNNKFSTPGEGVLLVAGADYEIIEEIAPWLGPYGEEVRWAWPKFNPVSLYASYAPYGTDEWQPLEGIEHQEEYDDIPGLGFFYQGSLAGVSTPSENGWFDLKFRLVDEAGNWQEQTLSPAFRIDALVQSAVTEVRDGSAHELARYSIDGKRVDDSHHGIVIVKLSNGTARKVLVP